MAALIDAGGPRASGASRRDAVGTEMFPTTGCSITRGTLLVLTDTRTTLGCPGAPDSEDLLLECVLSWMRSRGRDLPCAVMQLGFDAAGHPRLVVAVEGSDEPAPIGYGSAPDHPSVRMDVLPCTLVVLTDLADESTKSPWRDNEVELVTGIRRLLGALPDFTCEALQLGHDQTGRAQVVLAGQGWEDG